MIYDYQCLRCEREFEEDHGMSEPPIEKCEKCGGQVVRLITGAPTFILKGPGWFKDGYK